MHHIYGKLGIEDGNWYDAVIPNFFDVAAYPFQPQKRDFALYFGRLTRRKGVAIAIQVTESLGIPLVIAGQQGADQIDVSAPHVRCVGAVPACVEEVRGLQLIEVTTSAPPWSPWTWRVAWTRRDGPNRSLGTVNWAIPAGPGAW
jgi:glycosyltransferase involved in cell wall biosynthesis